MKLYIDPGTGSMLFAILMGVFGALSYIFRNWIVKLKFLLTGGKTEKVDKNKIPIVIFSDDKRYWSVFEPVCREFNKRKIDVVYMTASADDKALDNNYEHIKVEFIGEGNKAFARLNFLKAVIVMSTTPGLDVYQWKRSKNVDYYIHLPHAASDITLYRMFGIDYYDAVLLSGDYQAEDVRALEKMRNLPEKELVQVGIPYMDEMVARLSKTDSSSDSITVLLAPSWGDSAIFSKYGGKIIEQLISTGYHIIVRPHPQSFTSESKLIEGLINEFSENENIEWNRDADNFDVLCRSDILISDFSGVIFDFALVHNKPVIYTNTGFDKSPYDAWWLDKEPWTLSVLPKIGEELNDGNLDNIKTIIDNCLTDEKYADGRDEARKETWNYMGCGAVRTVDYVMKKYDEITTETGGE
ncbi:MAG: CDP-glycerol--glycerophosphate glycerophosphotransferase [Ruminococcaceae bacterium]|nr:CDP-glycerol--glycerophosphate glycerophosphotransferase [Oscillospiraceae bacterium]